MSKPKKRPTRGPQAGTRREQSRYQVFVSHATMDKWLAVTLCEKIELTGATTFRDDRDINGGDSIPAQIRSHIQQSRELIVLLTPESVNRPWVLFEAGAAWGRRLNYRIIPILCHVTVDAIPGIIEGKKAFHLNDFDNYLRELEKRVKK